MRPRRGIAAAALLLAGCATTQGTAPTSETSGFDGGRVVSIAPHGAACKSTVCTGLGAQWNSARPGAAVITVAVFNSITGITRAAISVDGRVVDLPAASVTNFSRPGDPVKLSRSDVGAPLQLLRDVAASRKAWLRVYTTDGYVEDAIVDGDVDSKALHALKRFLAEVDRMP